MTTKNKTLFGLIILAILDMIIPIPFAALLLIYVVLDKPAWFKNYLDEVYGKKDET
jgi:hypothetical protein